MSFLILDILVFCAPIGNLGSVKWNWLVNVVFTTGFIVSFNFNNPIVKLDAGVKHSVGSVWLLEIKSLCFFQRGWICTRAEVRIELHLIFGSNEWNNNSIREFYSLRISLERLNKFSKLDKYEVRDICLPTCLCTCLPIPVYTFDKLKVWSLVLTR